MTISKKLLSRYFHIFRHNCKYATQAAAAAQTRSQHAPLSKQDPKITVFPTGRIVASVENYSPITKISIIVKAGPRFETDENIGISHCLRNCAGLSTKNASVFGITRNIEFIGGSLTASATREHLIYTLECLRDSAKDAVSFLTEVACHPLFNHWEVSDFQPRMKYDVERVLHNPEALLLESLHKAAFRGGMSNSLFSPAYMLGKHTSEMLHDYVKDCFSSDRMAIAGIGLEHEDLLSYAENFNVENAKGTADGTSKYSGGEVRIGMDTPVTYAAVVMEGVSSQNPKEVLCMALLQQIIGTASNIKYSPGSASRLSKIVTKFAQYPMVSSINFNYSDTGLFGIYAVAPPQDISEILKSSVAGVKEVTKNGPTDKELTYAKQKLKTAFHMAHESDLLEEISSQATNFKSIIPLPELEKSIDAITAQDIVSVASKGLKSKPAMAVVGKPHSVVYVDEII